MTRQITISRILFTTAITLANACDAGAQGANTVGAPTQVVEPQIGEAVALHMMQLADLDGAEDVADYHIYAPQPDGLDLTQVGCGMPYDGPVDSTCGVCECVPGAGIVCIDFLCDSAAMGFVPAPVEDPQVSDAFTPGPARCEDGHLVGQSWMDDCNTCTCLADGTIACTLIKCSADTPHE